METEDSSQAEYNGFCNGIAGPMTAWSQNRDWTAILQNAKETYLAMPKAYEHGLKCQNIIDSLVSWSDFRTNYSNSTLKTVDLSDAIKMLEGVDHEKNWTKKLKTDDQTVLMTAKEAQKMESHALSKYQEVQLVGSTSV